MSIQKIPPPAYKVVAQGGAFVMGAMRACGAEIPDYASWPKARELAPINASAERIVSYHRLRHCDPFFPRQPWHPVHGFFLAAVLPRFTDNAPRGGPFNPAGSELLTPVSENERTPEMPTYTIQPRLMPAMKGQDGPRTRVIKQVGQRKLDPGEVFAFLGWPGPDFRPANEPAERVVAYHKANVGNSEMLSAPWCLYRQGLYLPDLAPPARLSMKTYPSGDYQPLDAHDPAVVAEIERVTGKRPGEPGSVPRSYPSSVTTSVR